MEQLADLLPAANPLSKSGDEKMQSMKVAIATALLLGAPSSAFAADKSPDEQLAETLAGLEPGESVRCISLRRVRSMKWLGTGTMLFKMNRSLIYRNDPPSGCGSRQRIGLTIVTNSDSLQICEGHVVGLVDLKNDLQAGACRLGRFTPYAKPDKAETD